MKFYSDIRVIPLENSIPEMLSKVVKRLHDSGDRGFALAFPEMKEGEKPLTGRFVRVFHNNEDALESLIEGIEADSSIKDGVAPKRIKNVPEVADDQYVIYRSVKVKSAKAINKTKTEKIKHDQIQRRIHDLELVDRLPYLRVRSNSNGNPMKISIQCEKAEKPDAESSNQTNSYGLSTREKLTPLPSF